MSRIRGLVVVVGLLGAVFVDAPIVSANAVKNGYCENYNIEICYFDGFVFYSRVYDNDSGNDGNLSNNTYPLSGGAGVNNTFNDVVNYSLWYMNVYDGFNGSAFLGCVPIGGFLDLAPNNTNKVSSHYRESGLC